MAADDVLDIAIVQAIQRREETFSGHGKDPANSLCLKVVDQNLPAMSHEFVLSFVHLGFPGSVAQRIGGCKLVTGSEGIRSDGTIKGDPMSDLNILGLCGSLRKASLNRKLMLEAARICDGELVEADLRLPLYDGDLEDEGMPQDVLRLAEQVAAADAIIIACPEYNKAPPGVLKNALDWISRVKPNPMNGKPVAIVSATSGRAGGERTQTMLRAMLAPHKAEALGWPEILVSGAAKEFDADGRLLNERNVANLEALMVRLKTAASGSA